MVQSVADVGIGIFYLFWPWPDDLHIYELEQYFLETYRMCKYEIELPMSRFSTIIIWQTNRQTRSKLYATLLHVWSSSSRCAVKLRSVFAGWQVSVWTELTCAALLNTQRQTDSFSLVSTTSDPLAPFSGKIHGGESKEAARALLLHNIQPCSWCH